MINFAKLANGRGYFPFEWSSPYFEQTCRIDVCMREDRNPEWVAKTDGSNIASPSWWRFAPVVSGFGSSKEAAVAHLEWIISERLKIYDDLENIA